MCRAEECERDTEQRTVSRKEVLAYARRYGFGMSDCASSFSIPISKSALSACKRVRGGVVSCLSAGVDWVYLTGAELGKEEAGAEG